MTNGTRVVLLGSVGLFFCAPHLAACRAANSVPDAAPDVGAAQDVDIVRPGMIKCSMCPEEILEVPASLSAGESFPVTVSTFGGGCESAHAMDVLVEDDGAELRPLDRTFIPAGAACNTALYPLQHADTLVFDSPGPKTLTVFGRWVTTVTDRVIQIETVITVQ